MYAPPFPGPYPPMGRMGRRKNDQQSFAIIGVMGIIFGAMLAIYVDRKLRGEYAPKLIVQQTENTENVDADYDYD